MSADHASADRARFRAQVKRSTRTTGITGGAIALIGFPLWAGFDHLVDPVHADQFTTLRLLLTVPLAVLWLLIIYGRVGRRYPEGLLFGILLTIDIGIAVMIANLDDHYGAYALGMSLPIYASAFLLVWSPAYTGALAAISIGALSLALLLSEPISSGNLATVYFYLVTAAALSFFGQLHRYRMAWREFESVSALERERERSGELVRELDRLSHEDPLTGLANRRAWDEAVARECARAKREDGALAILLCDVDQLKEINDRLGHAVGDVVLRSIGRLLGERTRETDLVARIGGDEFALLLPGTGLLAATELAEELRSQAESERSAAAGLRCVTVSIGVAVWEGGDDSPETIMLRVDRRLYTAKASRNVVCAGDPA